MLVNNLVMAENAIFLFGFSSTREHATPLKQNELLSANKQTALVAFTITRPGETFEDTDDTEDNGAVLAVITKRLPYPMNKSF